MTSVTKVLKRLPQNILPGQGSSVNEEYDTDKFVKKILSNPNIEDEIVKELGRTVSLVRAIETKPKSSTANEDEAKEKRGKSKRKRGLGLSNGRRRVARLHVLPKRGLKYTDFAAVHSMWCDYMNQLLGNDLLRISQSGEGSNKHLEELSTNICKADLIGAHLTVTRSKDVGSIGTQGFVAVETKHVFQILGKDNRIRTIPKKTCEFMFELGGYRLKFLGKYFCLRSSERSARKLRIPVFDDL